ncbi:MAG: 3-deoxy-D-manno-octulosonic acid transferase [Patiriisocius sp.]|uniref:3-deoxy-D-manno-octulosonic acid transferase n=1 Tax=Patiriisocius sp. TaxID=2822396 RepID=UPI003EF1D173
MQTVYNTLTYLIYAGLRVAQWFVPKLKLFVQGRKNTFTILSSEISKNDKTIWFHCASLGEFEQGLPIMEAMKLKFPKHKLVVSFFSPSGYENKKNTPIADTVVYLPMDTVANAKQFIKAINPTLAVFVKYEFWPNYLAQLKRNNIKTLLVSGVFREDQLFFKSYGNFMRKALHTFDHFFLQDKNSEVLLKQSGFENCTVSGDTRFDRVSRQIEMDNTLDYIEKFKSDSTCIVCGSTWPEDENVLVDYINNAPPPTKFIIAPHQIEFSKVASLREKLTVKNVLFSEIALENSASLDAPVPLESYQVFIVDTIGLLTKIYSYADIAYVGGAMGTTGLHNILEPATFGVPIVIGHNFSKFPEAERLRSLAGLFSISSKEECSEILDKLVNDKNFRSKTGMIAEHWINSNTGATTVVMDYLENSI